MIISIHQPQYFPWLPYLMKIAESDVFIILDSVDFQKNGLQNRNQIKTAQGACWLTVPVNQRLGQKIYEVKISDKIDWRKKNWLTIQSNYRKAAAFKNYAEELEALYQRDWTHLVDLDIFLLGLLLKWFKIETTLMRSSQMKSKGKGSDLILNLCLETGATKYISGIGGQNYLQEEGFSEAGIEIVYRPPVLPTNYLQLYPSVGFLNSLSALDIILNCGDEWTKYINK
jgi:hypothetical protein